MQTPTTDLATRPQTATPFDRITEALSAADKLGTWLCKSGLAGCQKDEEGKLMALSALLQRKDPLQLLREQYLMFGRFVMKSDHMLAKFKARPGNVWRWLNMGDDGIEARAEVTTPTDKQEICYRYADALTGGWAKRKDNLYDKDKPAMLRARLITKAVRIMDPEVIAGAGDEYEAAESAAPQPSLNLSTAQPAEAPPAPPAKTLDAHAEVLPAAFAKEAERVAPAPAIARVAAEMQARADQPLPADIQPIAPSAPLPPTEDNGTLAKVSPPERAAAEPQAPLFKPSVDQHGTVSETPASDLPPGVDAWLVAFVEKAPDKATPFFKSKNWLSGNQTWLDLKPAQIALLKQKPALFEKQMAAFAAK